MRLGSERSLGRIILAGMSILCVAVSAAWGIPTSEDIEAKDDSVQRIADEFMRQSAELRLGWEYAEKFFSEEDRLKMLELARVASVRIGNIYAEQVGDLRAIENYQGDDWDEIYGSTGLWRKGYSNVQQNEWFKCQMDRYAGQALAGKEREKVLGYIASKCEKGEGFFGGDKAKILHAEALALMGEKLKAGRIVNSVLGKRGLKDDVYLEGTMLRLKLEGEISAKDLKSLAFGLSRGKLKDDLEMNLRVAFMGLRGGFSWYLEEVIERWPGSGGFVGKLILSRLAGAGEDELDALSVAEVELAAQAALLEKGGTYRKLFSRVCTRQKFQKAIMFYAAAEAHVKSSREQAVGYYLLAAMAQKQEQSEILEVPALAIAQQGAWLGYELFLEDKKYCRIADRAIGYYCDIAGREIDEKMEYLYTGVLSDCGKEQEAQKKLAKIWRDGGKFANRGRLDMIIARVNQESGDRRKRNESAKELRELIDSAGWERGYDRGSKSEAVELYCMLLLENDDRGSAETVLEMLANEGTMAKEVHGRLQGQGLKQLGRFDDAAEVLAETVNRENCDAANECVEVLAALVKRIEKYEGRAGHYGVFLLNCEELAEYCVRCAGASWKAEAELIRCEIGAMSEGGTQKSRAEVEAILERLGKEGYQDNVDWVRCRARSYRSQGKFGEAARMWGMVRHARKPLKSGEKPGWEWWRGKYYELECWSRMGSTKEADVRHAIEVLQSSMSDIPAFWGEKLRGL